MKYSWESKLAVYALLINKNDFTVCNKNVKNVSHYENELMKPDIANFLKEKCWIKME